MVLLDHVFEDRYAGWKGWGGGCKSQEEEGGANISIRHGVSLITCERTQRTM